MITIIGLGVDMDDLTLAALKALETADVVYLRTERHATSKALSERGIAFKTMDDLYEQFESFEELYEAIADRLLKNANAVFAVPGSAAISDASVCAVTAACVAEGVEWSIIPGIGWAERAAALCGGVESVTELCAVDVAQALIDPRKTLIITEVNSKYIAGDVKIRLLEHYPGEHMVRFGKDEMPLYEIDRMDEGSIDTTLMLPPLPLEKVQRYDFYHLTQIMRMLRDPQKGCPWDIEQTRESLRRYLIEEAYEAIDAMAGDEPMRVADELGDVLLQAVFHAQISDERGEFNDMDITTSICRKMIGRHPHIFGNTHVEGSADVLDNWEKIKRDEKGINSLSDVLRDIPRTFPALMRAEKILDKTRRLPIPKPRHIALNDDCATDAGEMAGLIADALIALAEQARTFGINPEIILNKRLDRLVAIIGEVEELAGTESKNLENMDEDSFSLLLKTAKNKIDRA